MSFSHLLCRTCLCVSLAFLGQTPEPKELTENKGSIEGENTYVNPALKLKILLPGAWHFFDRTMYSTPESKQKDKEMIERNRAICQGPLCGDAEIDVALQTVTPFVHAIFLTAHQLSSEYQNRQRHPLKRFAEVMGLNSLGDGWVPEGELTAIQLGGRPAYRLLVHHKQTVTAKGFLYVADSNGRVFMLLGTAMSQPEKLQTAIENMTFTNPENPTSPPTQAADSTYLNTQEGLQKLLHEVLAVAKSGDGQKVKTFLKEMEIPNCEAWLHKMYESDKADSWMGLCDAKTLASNEKSMQELFAGLAKEEGEISTRKVNDNPQAGKGMEWGMLQAIRQPLDIYFASWKLCNGPKDSKSEPIGYFMFIDGGFRWDSGIRFLKPKISTAKLVPAKLLKKVDPAYPPEPSLSTSAELCASII